MTCYRACNVNQKHHKCLCCKLNKWYPIPICYKILNTPCPIFLEHFGIIVHFLLNYHVIKFIKFINHVLNKHEYVSENDPFFISLENMTCYSYPASCESALNLHWVVMLARSAGTNYAINKHYYVGQCGPYGMPCDIIPCWIFLAGFVNQHSVLTDLLGWQAHLVLNGALMN